VADQQDLARRDFRACRVTAKTLNITHPDPAQRGPFCRLIVEHTAPARPGVYAWTVDGSVVYVGMAGELRQIVHGARMHRAYNDYTYIPASKVGQVSSPRVRINGSLNRALNAGLSVAWWWLEAPSLEAASRLEARLISEWVPPWNRTRPMTL
jgi:hypothetical protein